MNRFFIFGLACISISFFASCSHVSIHKNELVFSDNAQLQDVQQLLWVLPPEKGVQTRVQRYEKHGTEWVKLPGEFSAVVGQKGLAELGEKVEGDLKTPQGLFSVRRAFGRSPAAETQLSYQQVSSEDKWIDDPNSDDYNQWVKGATTATSYERLLRNDELYDLSLVLEYNTSPIEKGKGSAIFMHLWKNKAEGTAGCVALDGESLKAIARWLDPAKKPMILVGSEKLLVDSNFE